MTTEGPPPTHRITADDVRHVAVLARLAVTDDEVETFTAQLADILGHADDVAALDLDDVPATSHPLPLRNVLRPDVPGPGIDRAEVLAQAPSVEDDKFKVPAILGDAP